MATLIFLVSWHRNDLLDFLSFHRQTKVFLKYWHADKLADQLLKAQEAVITIQKGTLQENDIKETPCFCRFRPISILSPISLVSWPSLKENKFTPPPLPITLTGLPLNLLSRLLTVERNETRLYSSVEIKIVIIFFDEHAISTP